jgi:hypothetical protein
MSYVAPDVEAFVGSIVGNGQCVEYIKASSGCPATSKWREGSLVKGKPLPSGTAIATFQKGVYNNYTDGRSHAAIYLNQTPDGIVVHDQWVGQPVHKRTIRFRGSATTPNNDGDAFAIIEDATVLNNIKKSLNMAG